MSRPLEADDLGTSLPGVGVVLGDDVGLDDFGLAVETFVEAG